MFKKSVGSFLAVSMLTVGVGAAVSAAGPETAQSQHISPWCHVSQLSQFATQNNTNQIGSIGVQAGSATSAQAQAANTSGPATAVQSGTTVVDQGNQIVGGTVAQSSTTGGPGQVIQSQVGHASGINFDLSIPGATIQHQTAHSTGVQYQAVTELPSK